MSENVSVMTAIPQFLDYCEKELGHSAKTIDNYKRELAKLGRWGGDRTIDSISIHDLTDYFRAEEARGLKVSSVNTSRRTIRSLFYYLQYYRRIPLLFDYGMIKQKKDYSDKSIRCATVDEVREVVAVLTDPQDKLIVLTLFSAGVRIGELVRLRVENIKDTNEIEVVGKGNVKRPIPINEELVDALRVHLETNGITSGTIFRHRVPKGSLANHGYTVSGLRNRFIRKLKPYGLYPSFHWYRHGIATSLYNDGADIRFVQEFLGHRDIRTTQVYTHVSAVRKREVYDKHFPKTLNINKLLT